MTDTGTQQPARPDSDSWISRRRFLGASVTALLGLAGYGVGVEPRTIRVTRHAIGSGPPSGARLRLIQLSDLHLGRVGGFETRVAERVEVLDPDVLVLTGDVVDSVEGLGILPDFLSLLPRRATTFATLGNWEHWAGLDMGRLDRIYAAHGVDLLVNRSESVRFEGAALLVTGTDDSTAGTPELERALRDVAAGPNHLLLTHSPAYRDILRGEPATADLLSTHRPELVLAGHTHGGQVNLLGWAPVRPYGSGRYLEGWYDDGPPPMYVSRGVGTSVLPCRIGAPPEIAVFDWRLAEVRASLPGSGAEPPGGLVPGGAP